MATPELVKAYRCYECEELIPEDRCDEEGTLYECQECGTLFSRANSYDGDSHRCPDCMKFSSKKADYACPECQEGELEECFLLQCPECDALMEQPEPTVDTKESTSEGYTVAHEEMRVMFDAMMAVYQDKGADLSDATKEVLGTARRVATMIFNRQPDVEKAAIG